MISQTSGHGDFRLPSERSRKFGGGVSRSELFGANFIADGTSEILTATRENLRFGASQIKLMAGGGTSSDYDPIDVTQYTFEEMKEGALADLLLVDGNPLARIEVLGDPAKNFDVIMKDGKIYKGGE